MNSRTELPDRREWPLTEYEVNYLHLDYRFGVDLLGFGNSHGYLRVVIGVPFVLTDGDSRVLVEPENVDSVARALRILHKRATAVVVFGDGALELRFQDGALLRVEKDDQYESWEAHGEGELQDIAFLCSPHPGPPWKPVESEGGPTTR